VSVLARRVAVTILLCSREYLPYHSTWP